MLTGQVNREKLAITGMEILTDALDFDKRHIGRKEEQRIAKVMKSLGYQRQKARISGKSVWAYVPEVPF
jgi:hypothetical protein